MSYLNQNYFNNFQVRNPVLKNPVNRNCPLQLQKVRPAGLTGPSTHSTSWDITTEDINNGALRVNPAYTNTTYVLPSADKLIQWLGVQSNGLPTPTYSTNVQQGDVLIVPVINTGVTGCKIVSRGNESTGAVPVPYFTGANRCGTLTNMVIDFTVVSPGPTGVTGSYIVYSSSNSTGAAF
jgi:hypothetical protein